MYILVFGRDIKNQTLEYFQAENGRFYFGSCALIFQKQLLANEINIIFYLYFY